MTEFYQAPPIPRDFIRRRLHSLMGIWLVLFLIEHLFTNSQAALLIGDDGLGFVRSVNALKNLPYLPVIEITLLGIPFLYHAVWGLHYLFTGKINSFPSDGTTPSLTQFPRNHAYTWQRITSWILLFGVIAHVVQMRFLDYPPSVQIGTQHYYMTRLTPDDGLKSLSERLGFTVHTSEQLAQESVWGDALKAKPLALNQVAAISPSFGLAELLMVRDTFKSPWMIFLYTAFVLAATFHSFNGLWTAMITWGVTLTVKAQQLMRKIAVSLMVLITFLGLAAIWGTYWINLYH